jgi:hypothetical protein
MKRTIFIAAVLTFAASLAFAAEESPDRSHVRISDVPRQCLESGSTNVGGMKFTCNKVDTSEVWNDAELRIFEKDIFEAFKTPESTSTRIGLVVRQDTKVTRATIDYQNEVAQVRKEPEGHKYKYTHK